MSALPGLGDTELRRLYQRSDRIALLHVGITVCWLFALFSFYLYFGPRTLSSKWLTIVIGFPFAGILQHRLSILHHETLHRILFRNRRANEIAGAIAGALIGFTMAYRAIHIAHHNRLGEDADPDLAKYRPFPGSGAHLARALVLTLSGIAAGLQFIAQARDPAPAARSGSRLDHGIGLVLLCQSALFAVCWRYGMPEAYVFGWLLPLATLAKSITFLRNVAEHVETGKPAGAAEPGRLRTIRCGVLEGVVFAPMNFNFHAEHHLYPAIPFYNLPEAHELLSRQPEYPASVALSSSYMRVLFREAIGSSAHPHRAGPG